jgi:hypothetical protein
MQQMSDALAYAMLLIHQHQADGLHRQQELQQLFLSFLARQLTAEQYERSLDRRGGIGTAATSSRLLPSP